MQGDDNTPLCKLVMAVMANSPEVQYKVKHSSINTEWSFRARLGTATLEKCIAGNHISFEHVSPAQLRLLAQLGLAVCNGENVLIQGPTCFKSHTVALLGRMLQSTTTPPLVEVFCHSDTETDALFGSLEPHTVTILLSVYYHYFTTHRKNL